MTEKKKDHEVSMAQSQLASAKTNILKLQKKLGKKERDIPAWIQAKITDTAHNMDAATSYKEGVSFDIGPGHKGAQRTQKIYNKAKEGAGTEKEWLKKTGPQLPLAKKNNKVQMAHYELEGSLISEREFDEPGEEDWRPDVRAHNKKYGGYKPKGYWRPKPKPGSGPSLPQAKAKTKVQVAHYEIDGDVIDEAKGKKDPCWKGYKQIGMKKKGGKEVPNCVPVSEEKKDPCWKGYTQVGMKKKNGREVPNCVPSAGVPKATGYKAESHDLKTFKQFCAEAAWTRKEGQNKNGGLNEKGRKSYERANPGSDLKAPSKKVGNPRRASFCARMSGMKKKLTSAKTANDPNSRINKSLRAWNC